MASTVITLPKDVWTQVLTNVTDTGMVAILPLDEEPTSYLAALVPTGDPSPAVDFEGGVLFDYSFSPSHSTASDYYVMPLNYDGKVVVIT